MEHHMWHHPATQRNIATLVKRGVDIVQPESGHLASGASGDGRLASTDRLLAAIRNRIDAGGPLSGRTVVVTAGGTREAIDPVRYLGNRSSGQMGVSIARAAADAGARVVLIAGPTVEHVPAGMDVRRVESARDMQAAVEHEVPGADVLIMAAAVADFRPREQHAQKLKKREGEDELTLELVKNPDIIAGVDGVSIVKVGFAAETENLLRNATAKLTSKGLAMIVANDAVATIGSDRVQATLLFANGREPVRLEDMPKDEAAVRIVAELQALLEAGVK
jgi:phosphopantothenoylcysteine decarboxylase/phosphopantothenate--cysteine ligase